jgi:ATP-dependent DNA helicase RecQ
LRQPEVLIGNFDRPNLTYRVDRRRELISQVREVLDRHPDQSGIIYTIAKKDVDALSAELNELGYSTKPYHAGLPEADRRSNQEAFIEDRERIIVATIAFGMGIDKPDVRFVVHAAMPKSLEHYQQESGRAGRDGLEAECCLFYSGKDLRTWQFMIDQQPESGKEMSLAALKRMADYCEAVTCRHQLLVRHFGQELPVDCGSACDVCLSELDLVPEPLVVGQKILSSVYRQGERFGADYTAKVLTGSRDERITKYSHDRLSTYGLLSEAGQPAVMQWIGQLVGQGFLLREGDFNTLKITPEGWRLLKGEVAPKLLRPKRRTKKTKEQRARQQHDADSWDGVDRGLFEELRKLRLRTATERGLPPYMIFDDAALRDMARRRPTSVSAFREVYGVGARKCADFGPDFVAAIGAYCRQHNVTADVIPVSPAATGDEMTERASTASERAAFALFDEGVGVDTAAQNLERARSTTMGYLIQYIRDRAVSDPGPWVESGIRTRVEAALDELQTERLKPIFEHLGREVDYDSIRIVLACLRNRLGASWNGPARGQESGSPGDAVPG